MAYLYKVPASTTGGCPFDREYYFFPKDGKLPDESYFSIYEDWWYNVVEICTTNGLPMDVDGPAICCYSRGNDDSWDLVSYGRYYEPGVNWHPTLPAGEECKNGVVLRRDWNNHNGVLYRKNGPAFVDFVKSVCMYRPSENDEELPIPEEERDRTPGFSSCGVPMSYRQSYYTWRAVEGSPCAPLTSPPESLCKSCSTEV